MKTTIVIKQIMCVCLLLTLWTTQANAGSQQTADIQHQPEEVATFAKGLEKYAAAQGARAFIISRVGRPAEDLPKGIIYTHTAIAVYSAITLNDGNVVNGYAIHNLYQDSEEKNRSSLITDYPVDFFWGAQRLSAGISIPTPAVQQRLIEAINNGVAQQVHNPNYSVIANPMNNKYQNCTEHTLLVLNSAIYQTTNLERLYENHKTYFTPQTVHSSPFKLMLGNAFVSGVTTADHKSKVKTATFGSISRYLNNYDLLYKSITLNANGRVTNNI